MAVKELRDIRKEMFAEMEQQSSNTSVITSIIQRQMEVFLFWTNLSVSIGKSQQSMPISQRKIRSMRC